MVYPWQRPPSSEHLCSYRNVHGLPLLNEHPEERLRLAAIVTKWRLYLLRPKCDDDVKLSTTT